MCFPTCFPLVFLGSPVRLDLRRLGGLQVPKPGATAGAGSWPVDPALAQLNFRKYGNYGNYGCMTITEKMAHYGNDDLFSMNCYEYECADIKITYVT